MKEIRHYSADEIFSFWIADPRVSLSETLNRAFSSSLNFFYDVGLKYFHMILVLFAMGQKLKEIEY